MFDVGRPRADGLELGQHLPDLGRCCINEAGPLDSGHKAMMSPEHVQTVIRRTRELTDRPVGVDLNGGTFTS